MPSRVILTPPEGFPRIDEVVFAEPWQASAFALVVSLHEKGLFGWAEWAATLAEVIAADRCVDPDYYEQWLRALEIVLARKGIASGFDVTRLAQAWQRAAEATPHGAPIVLENDPMAGKL